MKLENGILFFDERDENGNRYGVNIGSGELEPIAKITALYWKDTEKWKRVLRCCKRPRRI